MLLKPSFGSVHEGRMSADDAPEAIRMVRFKQMSKFVDDDVVDHEHRSFDQPPVKIDIIFNRAGTPAVAVVDDPYRAERGP